MKQSAYCYGTKPLHNFSDKISLMPYLYNCVNQICSSNVVIFG
jgi:hypothetical protein